MLVFWGEGTDQSTRRKPHQTQPTYGNRTRATLVESECSHHCVIAAPVPVSKLDTARGSVPAELHIISYGEETSVFFPPSDGSQGRQT